MTDRIQTTHVGTLQRPVAFEAGEMPLANAVVDVVRRQAALGIDVVDDGEFGKASWTGDAVERLMRFAERVGRERVMAGTDCGLGGRVHPHLAWAKLEALVEGAGRASARLWPG